MKNLIIACISISLGFFAVDAAAQTERTQPTQTPTQQERERPQQLERTQQMERTQQDLNRTSINEDQLPTGIRTTLSSDRYNTWKVSEAWQVNKDGKTYYEVRSSRGDMNETFKFDENGRLIEDKEKMKKRQ